MQNTFFGAQFATLDIYRVDNLCFILQHVCNREPCVQTAFFSRNPGCLIYNDFVTDRDTIAVTEMRALRINAIKVYNSMASCAKGGLYSYNTHINQT